MYTPGTFQTPTSVLGLGQVIQCVGHLRAETWPPILPTSPPQVKPQWFSKPDIMGTSWYRPPRPEVPDFGAWTYSSGRTSSAYNIPPKCRSPLFQGVGSLPCLFSYPSRCGLLFKLLVVESCSASLNVVSEWAVLHISCCFSVSVRGGELRSLLLCHLPFSFPSWGF